MSLLDRFAPGHLDEAQVSRLWTSGGGHPHLSACATCRARFEEFDQWLGDIGDRPARRGGRGVHPTNAWRRSRRRLRAGWRRSSVRPASSRFPRPPAPSSAATRTCAAGSPWPPQPASSPASASARSLDIHRPFDPARAPQRQLAGSPPPPEAARPVALTANDLEILSDADAFARPRVAALVRPGGHDAARAGDLTERPQITWPPPNR